MQPRPRVAVLGGGISGLTTAYRLRSGPDAPDVVLVEAERRLGGKVLTRSLDGRTVEAGPDAFVTRVPAMAQLVADLGLTGSLLAPAPLGSYVWSQGVLRRLPPGTVFGVPERLFPLLRSGLLSPRGVLRAGLDLVLPRRRLPHDPTVDDLVRPRFGAQVADRLVDPLVGGVHAGSTKQLSAASAVPDIEAMARDHRSLVLAVRGRGRRTSGSSGPALMSLDGGLVRLVDALADGLDGATVLTGRSVGALERAGHRFRVVLDDGEAVDADAVVVTTPAYVTAALLRDLAPGAAAALREVPYVDVATVTLSYPRTAVSRPLDATGFLVPPVDGRLLVGCTWLSAKWQHLDDGRSVLVRAMVGRAGDRRWTDLDDAELVARVHDELDRAMGLSAGPTDALVQRWPRALPQYTVGHRDRVARVDAAVAEVPGLFVTGAAYRGAGIAACVDQAERTAASVLSRLALPQPAQEVSP